VRIVEAWRTLTGKTQPISPQMEPAYGSISLQSACPACGNLGCEINFDAQTKKVNRKCSTCGCVVRQDPVAPSFFKS
jgi:hypothetical protein